MYRLIVFLYLLAIVLGDDIPKPKSHKNRRPNLPSGKIVGGVETPIKDVPYQVAILFHGSLVCSGSIITKRHILTASYCTTGFGAYELDVRIGTSDSESGGTVFKVKSLEGHPKYDSDTNDYDVSVMELKEDIKLNPRTAIITLAETEPVSGNALVAGWGDDANALQSVVVPIVNRTECDKAYHGDITARMICAGEKDKDFCDDDNGSPLVVGEKGMRIQVGIASWNARCGDRKKPGVYTNIADPEIRAFIKQQAGV